MLDHRFYVTEGVDRIRKGLEDFKTSQQESGNILLAAIIRNVEDQLSMIDGKNEIYPPQER